MNSSLDNELPKDLVQPPHATNTHQQILECGRRAVRNNFSLFVPQAEHLY